MAKGFKITIETKAPARGHMPHRSGAGQMQDKRTKRCRTRGAAFRKSLED